MHNTCQSVKGRQILNIEIADNVGYVSGSGHLSIHCLLRPRLKD